MLLSSEREDNKLILVIKTYCIRTGDEDADDRIAIEYEMPDVTNPEPLINAVWRVTMERLC